MPEERESKGIKGIKGIIKLIIVAIILIWLSIACLLSFMSMCFIVTLFAIPTITYSSPFMFPLFFAGFLFLSQLIPGYFAQNKGLMLLTLIFSALLVGVLFILIQGIIKGPIYAAACVAGNYLGFYIREKHR